MDSATLPVGEVTGRWDSRQRLAGTRPRPIELSAAHDRIRWQRVSI